MSKLTSKQEVALSKVTSSHRAYVEGKHLIRLELDREFEKRMASLQIERDKAVILADKSGVPRRRIHLDGMGMKSPNALYDILKREEASVDNQAHQRAEEASELRWIDQEQMIVGVKIENFPTTATADNYPEVLVGTVQKTTDGWKVLSDAGDTVDGLGFTLEGYLRWELGTDANSAVPTEGQDLRVKLDEWAEVNA